MCAIVGVINQKPENKETAKRIFKTLMVGNEIRGKDSTGVLAIEKESKKFSLFKDTIPSSIFMNRKKFRQTEGDIWIGHCRLATHGDVNQRNAHPLHRKDTLLVHNGVITNHEEIGKQLDLEYQVDSEILIPIVEKEDWDMLTTVKGSFNFIAWNTDRDKIYIERHDNPLYYAKFDELGILAFSSREDELEVMADHYGSKNVVGEFDPDTLVELNLEGKMTKIKKLEFPKEKYLPATQIKDWDRSEKYDDDFYRKKYPEYYDTDDDNEGYDENIAYGYGSLPLNEKDLECITCGCDIDLDEYNDGIQEWGIPLCYKCLAQSKTVETMLQRQEKVDFEDEAYKPYEFLFGDWQENI